MTKRAYVIIFIIFIIGIGVGLSFSKISSKSHEAKSVEITEEATSTAVIDGSSQETAVVKRVIDGDTIELTDGRKVRYIGIDTPETVDPRKPVGCFGRDAAQKNRELVDQKEIELEKDVSETDRYGRLLRYVYVGDVMVNEALVKLGFAQSSAYPPDVKYQERFDDGERMAREEGLGLWGSCTVSPTPTKISTPTQVLGDTASSPPNIQPTPVANNSATPTTPNENCIIKGNISSGGKIYHLPGCGSYDKTSIDEAAGEHWFCSEGEAEAAGWRKAKNC